MISHPCVLQAHLFKGDVDTSHTQISVEIVLEGEGIEIELVGSAALTRICDQQGYWLGICSACLRPWLVSVSMSSSHLTEIGNRGCRGVLDLPTLIECLEFGNAMP